MSLILSGTDGLSDVDGTVSTPAIRGTDSNTGIFFPAADTIAFAEGGAEAMRIDSSGNVGIGTSSPSGRLSTAVADGTTNAIYAERTGGSPVQLSVTFANQYSNLISSQVLSLHAGSTERGRFDTSGNFLFNSGYGSVATAFGCRAWVNFNGTGTPAIRGSGNVSSITDNGSGNYTINFTNAMPDANFTAVFGGARDSPPSNGVGGCALYAGTTTTQRLITSNSDFSATDFVTVMVAIFR